MTKKSFKDTTANIDKFFTGAGEEWTHDTQEPHDTHRTHNTYRINLKLNINHQDYLKAISWKQGKSITQYINDLIKLDKLAQGETEVLNLYKEIQGKQDT